MPSPTELTVLLFGEPAALLRRTRPQDYRLEYLPEWTATLDAVPISISLPLVPRVHTGRAVADFLDNLLPDSEGVRERWAREAGLDSAEPFLLLGAYGRDVAGALEFVDTEHGSRSREFRHVDVADIGARIQALRADRTAWRTATDDVGRFSLGGAQSKFALARQNDGWYEPSGAAPATHIFKPAVDRLEDGEVIEYLAMRSAAALGLPVAATTLERFDGHRSLVVERFDRVRRSNGHVDRLHQEDVLQALGRPRLQKYEAHGGPRYRDVLALLDRGWPDDAEASKESFVRTLAFNWLILNTDAHAKNFAVLLDSDSLHLAPLYDVSSLLPYLRGTSRREVEESTAASTLSMSALGSFRVGDVTAETWRSIARDARLSPDGLLSWTRDAAEHLADLVQAQIRELPSADTSPVTDSLNSRIRIRTTQALRALRR